MILRSLAAAALTTLGVFSGPARADQPGAPVSGEKNAQVVEVLVTKEGFVPATVSAKLGRPVQLVVTRKLERTCVTEVVMKDFGINQPLPLGQPVSIVIQPKRPGQYRFSCGMDMVAGMLNVE